MNILKRMIYEEKSRNLVIQVLFLLGCVGVAIFLGNNAASNLKAQGVASGFGFLSETAGFSVIQSLIPYSEESSYFSVFLVGLLNTLLISAVGIVLSTVVGVIVGVARLSENYLVSKVSEWYIEIVRNIPLLIQIFFWYFVVLRALPHPRKSYSLFDAFFINNRGFYVPSPEASSGSWIFAITLILGFGAFFFYRSKENKAKDATGNLSRKSYFILVALPFVIFLENFLLGSPFSLSFPELKGFNFKGGVSLIPEFTALLISLVIYTGAFIAEIVRAGIMAVPKGQIEAAQALGLRKSVILTKITIPQALRVIIPPLTSQYLNLTKNSSLAAAIGYPELVSVFAGTVLNQTGQAVEVIFITMSVYMVISLSISVAMNIYNKKKAIIER